MSVTAAAALALTGCSASTSDSPTDADAGAAAPATTAATTETTTADDAAGADDATAGKEVCAHLKKELPRIKAVGSEVGAMAQLTMSLSSFYETHDKLADGTVLDAQTEASCPQVKAEILKAAGMTSFADF